MISRITGVQRQVLTAASLYLGQMLSGFSVSWSGPVLPKLRDLEQSPLPYLLTETQLSLVATLLYIGTISGPYTTLWLSNTRGRKPCLIAGGAITLVAYIILASAQNLAMLYIGRILIGIGCGSIAVMNLVYLGEMASTHIRGILLTAVGLFNTVGSIVLFSVGPFVSYRGTNYIGIVIALMFILSAIWIPESPFFYILQGKDKEVTKVLEVLGRSDDKENLFEMKKELEESDTKKEWRDLFINKSNRKALIIVIIINILQNASGVIPVVFFSDTIFKLAGSSISSNIAMIVIGFFQLSGSVVTPIFIERVGRKLILALSSALCSLSMFILGLYFFLDHIGSPVVNSLKWLPLVILIIFYIGYDSGLGIIPNAIIGEMFTTNVRSKGSTLTMTTSWVFGFVVTTAFGALLETIGGHVAFWFFACTCACAVLFTIFFIPETKGKTLAEIQKSL